MDRIKQRTWAEISPAAIEHNAREIRRVLPENCGILAVIKADGYGHGAITAARALKKAGCDFFGVACCEEALALRAGGVRERILILSAVDASRASEMAEHRVSLTVECIEKAQALSAALQPGQQLRIHVKLDTGMGRIGFPAAEEAGIRAAADSLRLPGLVPEGIFTHFSVSDTAGEEIYTRGQFALFQMAADTLEALSGKKFTFRHCSNSGAVLSYREEGFPLDLVRPGLLLYGIASGGRGGLRLLPAMQLKSRVAAIARHRRGDSVSYGRFWTAERDCTLAVIPIGYADGLQRCLSGKLEVLLRGRRVRQVGRICMDACMLDVTDIPEAAVGDEAIIFGREENAPSVSDVAAWAGTIPYEILCGVSSRVPRLTEAE